MFNEYTTDLSEKFIGLERLPEEKQNRVTQQYIDNKIKI